MNSLSSPRVLHATEAMGGGIVTFLASITSRQVAEGSDVAVLYTRRLDTPGLENLRARFDPRVRFLPEVQNANLLKSLLLFRKSLREASRSADVVHLHSSIAGAIGRLSIPRSTLVVYSPHGYSFLRLNRTVLSRSLTWISEALLARRGSVLVTSLGEVELASRMAAPRVAYLQSGIPSSSIREGTKTTSTTTRPQVVMVGRMTYQKAPWRFAAVARRLHQSADFVWVGGSDSAEQDAWLSDAPVRIIEWLSPEDLQNFLADADVLLFASLWEGSALSLMQAQSLGLPAVVSNVVGNRDTVIDGVTGYICDTDEELVLATSCLIADEKLRHRMAAAAIAHARSRMTDDEIGRHSLRQYQRWSARQRRWKQLGRWSDNF